jgi:Carboxypeptidase regulatory-like domain
MRRFTLLTVFAVLVLGLSVAFAQSDSARIVGTVTDASGANVQGATITVTNLGTGRVLSATSAPTGNFQFSALPPGRYHVEAKQKNFKTMTADVTLQISQVQEVNFKLQLGSVETTVSVTDEVALVDTATSSTGEVIQGRQVTELPLNGRNFVQLALLAPGTTRGAYGDIASGGSSGSSAETWRYSDTGGAALSVNGLRPQVNNFLLDGVDNNESLVNSIVFFPPAEAIQEFKVNTSVAPAEFGRAGGAVIQTSIKSGTNRLHGSVFDFRRTGFGDAHVWNQTGPIDYKRNQFGGTLGGAIIKNKLFFFGDYQGWRQNQPVGDGTTSVPTDKMRTGDFSELLGLSNNVTSIPAQATSPLCSTSGLYNSDGTVNSKFSGKNYIYNPQTCLPFGWIGDGFTGAPGGAGVINVIPAAYQNSVGLKYLNAFPEPNVAGAVQNNFQPHRQQVRNSDDFDVRMDFYPTQKDAIFGRFSYGQDYFTVTDRLVDATHDLPSGWGSGDNPAKPRGFATGFTHTFNQNLINDFRFGYTDYSYGYNPPLANVPLAANLGIPNANRNSLLGGMALIGGWSGQLEYTGDGGPYLVPQKTFDFNDGLSWTRGNHTFKFGASVMHRGVDFIQGNNAKGYFWIDDNNNHNMSDVVGHGAFTGYEVSELLAGFVGAYSIGNANGYYETRNWETGYYAQDDWRVNDKLTLNLGLRYDLYTWPTEANNRMSNFDPTRGILVEAGTPQAAGYNSSLINTDKNNFAPRIGFAYDLFGTGKTVLRGGFGVFYFLDRGGVGNQLNQNPDFNGVSQYNACPSSSSCANGYRITLSGAAPLGSNDVTVATGTLPSGAAAADPNNLNATNNLIYYPKNNQNSYVQQWNVQVAQALTPNTALNVAYVGTKMDDLTTIYNANQAHWFSNIGAITESANIGSGNYNGLQMSLNHRMTRGLQYTVSYTWSHTLDNANGGVSGADSHIVVDNKGNALLQDNWGNSPMDFRHYFVASAIYELPWGRGRRWLTDVPKSIDAILGGWQLNNIVTLGSGGAFDVTGGSGLNGRPNYSGGCTVTGALGSSAPWLSCPASALTDPGAGVVGTLPRNYFHGPGYHTWDASIFKQFSITERVKTEFRVQGYNLTNTPAMQNPDGGWNGGSNGNFGKVTNSRFSSERQLEFGLRFIF